MHTSTIRLVHGIAQMCECQVFFSLISQMVCGSICTHLVYNLLPPFKPKIIANISLIVSTKYFKSFFFKRNSDFVTKYLVSISTWRRFLKKKSRDHEYQMGGHFIGKPSSFFAKGSKAIYSYWNLRQDSFSS